MLHASNPNKLSDDHFHPGELKYLVKGNQVRMLDGRRTPGIIEEVSVDEALFYVLITDFEDKGSQLEHELESVHHFQFLKSEETKILNEEEVHHMQERIDHFNQTLIIEINLENQKQTDKVIEQKKDDIIKWLHQSQLLNEITDFNVLNESYYTTIQHTLQNYMNAQGLLSLEEQTATALVLNPYASQWIKAVQIAMAKLHLQRFKGKIPRKSFHNDEKLEQYIINRIAFVRAYLTLLQINKITIYRGMSSEQDYKRRDKFFTSWTIKLDVAQAFSSIEGNAPTGDLLKRTVPIEKLLFTCIETEEMNAQYKEYETILFYNEQEGFF